MGTKLPSTAASGDYSGDSLGLCNWHPEKESWRRDRAVQGNKTADVLRYTESGGDPVRGEKSIKTPVTGLSGQNVFADEEMKRYERQFGGLIEQADLVFVFYDVASGILKTDQIEFESDKYVPLRVDFEPQSGRIDVLAQLNKSDV